MLVHVHGTRVPAVRISAGGIIPNSARARRKPDVKRIDEDPVRIVRIDGDSLVVPVLGIVALATSAVPEGAALRTFHETPSRTAIRCCPGADLAASGIAAPAIIVTNNGLHLSV